MTQYRLRWFVILLAIVISVRIPTWQSHACCPAYREGARIQIADQKILIAWDPNTQMEHFIREAGFKRSPQIRDRNGEVEDKTAVRVNGDDDFGFLVPSPTQPIVEASDGTVFNRLTEAIAPKVTHKSQWSVMPIIGIMAPFLLLETSVPTSERAELPSRSGVDVLETKQVAGYDVSVLRADDATALNDWLASNGYNPRTGLEEWVEPYVAAGWIITAFKYSSHASQKVEASAIRISFKTDRPIFPYRVPTDQITEPGQGHMLRTFVIGPGHATGSLGDLAANGESMNSKPYLQGRVRYSMPLRAEQPSQLLEGVLPTEDQSAFAHSWLTAFDDPTWPSSAQDLWFDFDAQAKPYQETHVITDHRSIMLPIDLMGILAVLVVRRYRKRAPLSKADTMN